VNGTEEDKILANENVPSRFFITVHARSSTSNHTLFFLYALPCLTQSEINFSGSEDRMKWLDFMARSILKPGARIFQGHYRNTFPNKRSSGKSSTGMR